MLIIHYDSQRNMYVPAKQNHFPDPKFSVRGMHYMFFTSEIFCIMLDNVRSKFFIDNI